MTTERWGFKARPGEGVRPPVTPDQPETRESHHNIIPPWLTRRRLLGGVTAALTGVGVGYLLGPSGGPDTDDGALPTPTKSAEIQKPRGDFEQVPRVFYGPNGEPMELRREQLSPPDTLDPPTFEQAFANVGQALEYYVNVGDMAGIEDVIPGTTNIDAMQPGQLMMRAAFLPGYRQSAERMDHIYESNPENHPKYYAWGFRVELLEQLTEQGADIADTEMVTGRVRIAMGDYRPLIDGHNRAWKIEKPVAFETDMTITRYLNIGLNARRRDNGWVIYQINDMPGIPHFLGQHRPLGYEQIPPLYKSRVR